ncbi:MAG TPA: hypothetical protein VNJ07_14745 [Chitinophagales bacterium]|nr:hypothetical protein [Chitinophagales bacterium]
MKKFNPLLIVPALFFSCSNDLDIAADYKETTIVYGLLNLADDTVHYVQVFKGYLDENTSALLLAQNPDSIYYDDSAEVKLEADAQVHILKKIDAAQIGLQRDEGIFVDSPNYVYRLSGPLQDAVYHFTFTNKRTGHTVTAQTPVVKDFSINRPSPLLPVNLATSAPNQVQWRSAENGKIYQAIMRFYYEEWSIHSPAAVDTLHIDWLLFNNVTSPATTGNESMTHEFDGTQFLSFLGTQLEAAPDLRRKALDEPLEFLFYVGAEDLYDYLRVNGAQTGITSLQVKPEFTNITNGLGIFSSRYNKTLSGIKITDRSIDSLSCGSHTKNLNFVNSVNCD